MTEQSVIHKPQVDEKLLELFPDVVKRSYERALESQFRFAKVIAQSGADFPKESCICLSGSTSRLECVNDSDIDYVLIWDDHQSPSITADYVVDRLKSEIAVDKINSVLSKNNLRPCDSFSCQKTISELTSTENLFSRYSILTLVDSTFIAGNAEAYQDFLNRIKQSLSDYAIGISADAQVIRTLVWYIQREGWIDQLHAGTSVNRFSRLIQLFTTILSINQFGIDSTRAVKTTWSRIESLDPFVPRETTLCLKKLWTRALVLKENRKERPMLKDSGFTGVSQLMEIWCQILSISQAPIV